MARFILQCTQTEPRRRLTFGNRARLAWATVLLQQRREKLRPLQGGWKGVEAIRFSPFLTPLTCGKSTTGCALGVERSRNRGRGTYHVACRSEPPAGFAGGDLASASASPASPSRAIQPMRAGAVTNHPRRRIANIMRHRRISRPMPPSWSTPIPARCCTRPIPDAPRHPASLTKIMTLYLLFERLEAGKIKLDTPMKVSEHAASRRRPSSACRPGRRIEVEDAIKGLVTKSANDAAVVVAEAIGGNEDDFAELMTQQGARARHDATRSIATPPACRTTSRSPPRATRRCSARAIQERFPKLLPVFLDPRASSIAAVRSRNHNHLLGKVEGVDGIKTGYTRASGFNLVTSVQRGDRHIVAVVLGGRTAGSRDARMRELIEQHIAEASTKRTASMVAEAEQAEVPRRRCAQADALAPTPVPRRAEGRQRSRAERQRRTLQRRSQRKLSACDCGPAMAAAPTPVKRHAAPRFDRSDPPGDGQDDHGQAGTARPQRPPASTAAPADRRRSHAAERRAPLRRSAGGRRAARTAPPAPEPAAAAAPGHAPAMRCRARRAAPRSTPLAPPAATPHGRPRQRPPMAAAPHSPRPPSRQASPQRLGDPGRRLRGRGAKPSSSSQRGQEQGRARSCSKAEPFIERIVKGAKTYYRARFAGFDQDQAEAACKRLKREDIAAWR